MEVVRYQTAHAEGWNRFVQSAANGTFLFHRNFMEYHAHRFTDASLLLFQRKKLMAIFPANQVGKVVQSHGGLSFGGLLVPHSLRFEETLACWAALSAFWIANGVEQVLYKAVPGYYHRSPLFTDVGLLQKVGSTPQVEFASVVDVRHPLPYQKRRARAIQKARNARLQLYADSNQWASFWDLLSENLRQRHGLQPTHTLEEIKRLKHQFPNQIQLHICTTQQGVLLAGIVLFLHPTVAHAQYIANGEQGRNLGALDFLLDGIIRRFRHLPFVGLGVSDYRNEAGEINSGLTTWKEGFGARAYPHYAFTILPKQLTDLQKIMI